MDLIRLIFASGIFVMTWNETNDLYLYIYLYIYIYIYIYIFVCVSNKIDYDKCTRLLDDEKAKFIISLIFFFLDEE